MPIPFTKRSIGTRRLLNLALLWSLSLMLIVSFVVTAESQSRDSGSRFEKDGLGFDYSSLWELSDQSNPAAQQLVLMEKALDAQIMIIALRSPITNAKQEEQAKTGLIEPSISRLLKQYEDAGIKVERVPMKIDVNGVSADGVQLRFAIDGQQGTTDTLWLMINHRLVQLFFIRAEKTAPKATECWDMVRSTLQITKPTKTKQ